MAGTFTDEGTLLEIQYLLGITNPGSLQVMLFTSPTTWSNTTTYAALTEVNSSTLPGYARFTFTAGAWVIVAVATADYKATYPTLTWTFGANAGGITIYGFAVIDASAGPKTLYGDTFGTGITVPSAGMVLTLDLVYEHHQC